MVFHVFMVAQSFPQFPLFVHGSALFTRGETQALVVTTLGALRDSQIIEDLGGSRKDPFMLHYNFPPYSVGEAGFMGGPKRREIGHGRLARRGVAAVMPTEEEFPYAIRVVSEITESNGSSSMASVCGSSLAMMDAGVPVTAPVAGIAMGLIKEGERFAVLTDILGDEDHLGDMDFKVAGTNKGVTALQMDIKIQGITEEIMEIALEQANTARIHILGEMNKVISTAREEVSENAPAMAMIKIDPDKIRDVIGKGGAVIRGITADTGASVDIDDDGNVRIYGEDADSRDAAVEMVNAITAEAEIGKLYMGKVARIVDFGAFITIIPGKDGLVHISQISQERVENVNEHMSEGEEILVKCTDLDARGRIKLSIKEITEEERAILTDELIIKLITLFPTKANRLLGNKSGKPQEFLEEILTEVNKKYDWSSIKNGGKNRTGDHVKAGGDMFRKESEGGVYISYYISYKNSDDWSVGISYKQKSADKSPYIQVGKRQVRKDSEFEPYQEDFPIETRLDAIDIFKSHLIGVAEER